MRTWFNVLPPAHHALKASREQTTVAAPSMRKSAFRCRALPGHRTRSPKDGLPRKLKWAPPDAARL